MFKLPHWHKSLTSNITKNTSMNTGLDSVKHISRHHNTHASSMIIISNTSDMKYSHDTHSRQHICFPNNSSLQNTNASYARLRSYTSTPRTQYYLSSYSIHNLRLRTRHVSQVHISPNKLDVTHLTASDSNKYGSRHHDISIYTHHVIHKSHLIRPIQHTVSYTSLTTAYARVTSSNACLISPYARNTIPYAPLNIRKRQYHDFIRAESLGYRKEQ